MKHIGLFLAGILLLTAVSCRSGAEEFECRTSERAVIQLLRKKNGEFSAEARIITENRGDNSFGTNSLRFPTLLLKEGKWGTIAVSRIPNKQNRRERVLFVQNGEETAYLYPENGLYLKMKAEAAGKDLFRITGFLRKNENGLLLQSPFSAVIPAGGSYMIVQKDF